MNRVLALITAIAALIGLGNAGAPKAPEKLGGHWVRMSDRSQIELLVDELRSAPHNSVRARIAGANIATAQKSNSSIEVAGDHATVRLASGEQVKLARVNNAWTVVSALPAPSTFVSRPKSGGVTVGSTFIMTPVSSEHGIDRLTRSVARQNLDRSLFGVPEKTASYYTVRYMQSAPFVSSTYVQFVIDPAWGRILYGNLSHWIREYTAVKGPSSIAVDSDGRVFVGEVGNRRVSVLRVVGEGAQAQLQPLFTINDVHPTDLALNDHGTPLNTSDDILYVCDATSNSIAKYSLNAGSAVRVAEFTGFDNPTVLASGRWNGSHNSLVYVVDRMAQRVRSFEDQGSALVEVAGFTGDHSQYFSSIRVDHFGHVYLADPVNSTLSKYTPSLQLLDTDGGEEVYDALASIDIPFGRITIDGQGTYWVGFDQLFALERWSENTGVQRRTLGIALRDITFGTDADASVISNDFTLTDVSDVSVRVFDESNTMVRSIASSWMVSGDKAVTWDRRTSSGEQVAPGDYRYEIVAKPAYRDEPVVSQTRFYVPMYYWQDCGSTASTDDRHLVTGTAVRRGSSPSQSVNEDASAVEYRFSGLNPESEYEVMAEYISLDGVHRLQDMTANGMRIHDPVSVGSAGVATGYISLPKQSYAGGDVRISINRRGEGTASISQLWIKETGAGFSAQQIDEQIPVAYDLAQNFPNPFNPSTTIRYALPADGNVTVKVFDVNGREVTTLVNDFRKAGTHDIRFDARNIASGIYFYHIRAGSFSATRKMVLLK